MFRSRGKLTEERAFSKSFFKYIHILSIISFALIASDVQAYSSPNLSNPAYASPDNPLALNANVGQCTWYVYGRIQETGLITAQKLSNLGIFQGSADTWYSDATSSDFTTGHQPKSGAIAYWNASSVPPHGHVAFIEDDSGQLTQSNMTPTPNYDVIIDGVVPNDQNYVWLHSSRDASISTRIWKAPQFTVMHVKSGPVTANGYQWYELSDDNGHDGYAALLDANTGLAATNNFVWNFTRIQLSPGPQTWLINNPPPSWYIYRDTTPPEISAFSVTPTSLTVEDSVTISYTASDTGGSGLKTAQLWRAPDSGYGAPGIWQQIGSSIDISSGGNGPFQGLFSDIPPLAGQWWYGVHVNDGASPSNWNDEKNSQTNEIPGVFGPKMVTVNAQDTTAPYNIASFTATPGNGQVNLAWANPIDLDYAGVRIVRKIGSYPTSPTDGTCIYNSNGTSTIDTGLTNGTTYYHKAFSYNGVPNYSDGVTANSTPQQTFQPPTVTGISPTSGPTVGGTTVSITGTNFNGTPTVKFGTVAATIEWYTAGQIVVLCPAETAGTVHVTVVTVGGTSATSSADQFNYVALDAPITNAMGSDDTSSPGPVLANNQPTFTWNAVSGATGGYVLVITDLTANAIYGYNLAAETTSFPMPADTLPNVHAFKWSMESVAGSFYSSPSQNRYFQTPPPAGKPEIAVEGWIGGTAGYIYNGLSNGWGTYFGTVPQNSTPPTRTYTVQNIGTAPLTLGTVTVPSGFTIIEPLADSIAPGGSDDFTAEMSTSTVGTVSGNISFTNNDVAESPFSFAISGTVMFTGAAATTTVLNVSPSSVVYGQPVTFTALTGVIPPGSGTPNGGTVTFMVGSTPLGWTTLNNGNAVLTTTSLPAGLHSVTAIYSGDGSNFSGSSTNIGSNLILSTVAGNGPHGYSGDGGPATAASLSFPNGVAVDSSGNLFIADTSNGVVREVDHSTGIITTVAGIYGSTGYNGDNIQATAAQLGCPYAVAVDNSANLFVADGPNGRIRKVNLSTGIITTVAGNGNDTPPYFTGDNGPATAASLCVPKGVAVDNSGNLFIADTQNNRIRKVDHSTGIITTVAGGGTGSLGDNGSATAALLSGPTGVAVDATGNLFIADYWNNRIRKVDHTTHIITTVAGNGTAGYGGDNIQATTAELNCPWGVAIDTSGHLFIGDKNNGRLRKVDFSTGIITTVAGGGIFWDYGPAIAASVTGPSQIAVDTSGNIFVAEGNGWRIREIAQGNMSVNVISTTIKEDLNMDGKVDFTDYAIFVDNWMYQNCNEPYWCEGTDFDHSGSVDIADLATFAEYWLSGIE